MAWIKNFEVRPGRGRMQPSRVVGVLKVFELTEGAPIIQIDTHGSAGREKPGKQSRTIQMGRDAAHELFQILKRTYQFN